MSATRFTNLVGCALPVQLAAMGGVGTTELANAVAAAGGLGMVPAGTQPGAAACGVNFLMPFDPSLDDIAAAASQCRVVEFFYSDPRADVVTAAHAAGAIAEYVRMVLAGASIDTTLTEWFSDGWANAPHRVVRSCVTAAQKTGWKATVPPYRGVDRDPSDMAMYAGMGVGDVNSRQPAAEVGADLVRLLLSRTSSTSMHKCCNQWHSLHAFLHSG